MKNLLTCIQSREKPVSDIEQGYISATACILANMSQKLGRSLTWDHVKGEIVGDAEANKLLARPYRAPYKHPDASSCSHGVVAPVRAAVDRTARVPAPRRAQRRDATARSRPAAGRERPVTTYNVAMSRWFAGAALAATLLGAAVAAPRLAAQAAQPPRGIVNTFGQVCANCHGATGSGGSAPSLLDDTWAHGGSDAEIAASIKNGWPGTPMLPFGATLNEQDIRVDGDLHPRAARARRPRTAVAHRAAAAADRRRDIRAAWVPYRDRRRRASQNPWDVEILPDGALLVPERSGRLRIVRNGVAGPPITGLPPIWVRQDGGLMDIALHPDYAKHRLALPRVQRDRRHRPGRVDHARHPRQDQGRRAHRAADAVPGLAGSLLARQHPLRRRASSSTRTSTSTTRSATAATSTRRRT